MNSVENLNSQLPELIQKLQIVLNALDSIEIHGKNNVDNMMIAMRYTAEVGIILSKFQESYKEEIQNAGTDISGKPNSDPV